MEEGRNGKEPNVIIPHNIRKTRVVGHIGTEYEMAAKIGSN